MEPQSPDWGSRAFPSGNRGTQSAPGLQSFPRRFPAHAPSLGNLSLKESWHVGYMTAEDNHGAADLPNIKSQKIPAGLFSLYRGESASTANSVAKSIHFEWCNPMKCGLMISPTSIFPPSGFRWSKARPSLR